MKDVCWFTLNPSFQILLGVLYSLLCQFGPPSFHAQLKATPITYWWLNYLFTCMVDSFVKISMKKLSYYNYCMFTDTTSLNIEDVGILAALPYLAMALTAQFSGIIVDTLRSKYNISTTKVKINRFFLLMAFFYGRGDLFLLYSKRINDSFQRSGS